MGKILIIAEKPEVGRSIARALNCGQQTGQGYIEGDKYIISWAIGHLVCLANPEEYNQAYSKWRMEDLPIIPKNFILKISGDKLLQYRVLHKLIRSNDVESLMCATDSGREGELIFRYIYTLSGTKKPFKRLWFSSLTPEAIRKAFDNLKDGSHYDNLYLAAKARSEADWLVGMNGTRAFTLAFKNLSSIGRVQTPTLNILVQRELEILNFKQKTFYQITGEFNNDSCRFSAVYYPESKWAKKDNADASWIDTKKKADKLLNIILSKNRDKWKVEDLKENTVNKKPPLLYDLTELQQDCNRLYGFTAKKTIELAQSLYENLNAISYPRTDSRYLSSDMAKSIKDNVQVIRRVKPYSDYSKFIPNELPITDRIIDDGKVSDHHAIIPTGFIPDKMADSEFKVFDLVVRRFLCSFMGDYRYLSFSVDIKHQDIPGCFYTSWKKVLERGWTVIYSRNVLQDGIEPDCIMSLIKGQLLSLASADVSEIKTQPPQRYTDASLLSIMEGAGRLATDPEIKEQLKKKGIGTPATRAAIIEKLISTGYVRRTGKSLVPEDKGMRLIKLLDVFPEIKSPELTGEWELKLSKIESGELRYEEFRKDIDSFAYSIVRKAEKNTQSFSFSSLFRIGNLLGIRKG